MRRQRALVIGPAVRGRLDGDQHAGAVIEVDHLALARLVHGARIEAELRLHRAMRRGRLGRDLRYFDDR